MVTSVLIPEVLRLAHDEHFSGHQGSKKTLFRILCRFWWPTIQKDVVNYTQSCTIYAQRMPVNKRARAPLLGRPKATKPFKIIEMDIKGLCQEPIGVSNIFWWYKTLSHGMPRCLAC